MSGILVIPKKLTPIKPDARSTNNRLDVLKSNSEPGTPQNAASTSANTNNNIDRIAPKQIKPLPIYLTQKVDFIYRTKKIKTLFNRDLARDVQVAKPTSSQKHKAKEAALSTSAGSLEPAPRRQATVQPPIARKAQSGLDTMDAQDCFVGEQSTKCVRQPGSAGVEVAYAGVVAGQLAANKKSLVDGHPAASKQSSGSSAPSAKGTIQ